MTPEEFVEQAQARLGALGTVALLRDLRPFPDQLQTAGQLHIVEQAMKLISQFYVNLLLKREIHATDPEQALRNLRNELLDIQRAGLMTISDEVFHERMAAIFTALRDRHTVYELPEPYRRTIAFLPFVVERSAEPRGYFVTRVSGEFERGFKTPTTAAEAPRVTHWNGVPIERAVWLNGERNAGANREARMARGLERLTFRWMGTTTGPDEDWVELDYEIDGRPDHQRFHWCAVTATDDIVADISAQGTGVGRDGEGEWIRRVKTGLHNRRQPTTIGRDRFFHRDRTIDGKTYRYLRVYTFDMPDSDEDEFIEELARIITTDPPDGGLIIDVRGNPGGQITAAERLVGLFAAEPVQQQRLAFRNTPEATSLAETLYAGRNMIRDNVLEARATAAPFIPSLPLADRESDDSQVYQGPVMVVFDALTYSAAEVFTAGMLDQGVGEVRGTARQTGGGGANVWTYELLASMLNPKREDGVVDERPDVLPPLPGSTSFKVAIRRITRIGRRMGVALEDLGVMVSSLDVFAVTLDDLMGNNDRLIARAAQELDQLTRHSLSASKDATGTWTIASSGIDLAVALLDGKIFRGVDEPDGRPLELPNGHSAASRLTLRGYSGGSVVASVSYALSG
jgi:C-terminal processing protease CtpA/Prc